MKLKCESLENLVQEQAIRINAINVKIEDLDLAGPVRHLSDRSIRSMDRSEIFDISGTGPRSLISKQMN